MTPPTHSRPVGIWLLIVAAAILVQVLLGAVTRLTDSGLSITEWKPLLGVLPPTNAQSWTQAFAQYRQIPQFKQLKSQLTLEEFKSIYFWEWFHRLWGRLLGIGFFIPFVIFWKRGYLRGLTLKLAGLFALGAAQGVMGWLMVVSGLKDALYVSPVRLAIHFMLAVLLLSALLWLGLGLTRLRPPQQPVQGRPLWLRRWTFILLGVLAVQLTFGALMAGLKGALVAPTWPTINGQWVPSGMLRHGFLWNNPLAVHFVHRGLAYCLVLALGVWHFATRKTLGAWRHVVLGLVGAQLLLGIAVTLQAPYAQRFLGLAAAHQLLGLLLWVALLGAYWLLQYVHGSGNETVT